MRMRDDIEFYRRRERQERSLAERSDNAESRCIHLDLATRYARLIEEAQAPRPILRMPEQG